MKLSIFWTAFTSFQGSPFRVIKMIKCPVKLPQFFIILTILFCTFSAKAESFTFQTNLGFRWEMSAQLSHDFEGFLAKELAKLKFASLKVSFWSASPFSLKLRLMTKLSAVLVCRFWRLLCTMTATTTSTRHMMPKIGPTIDPILLEVDDLDVPRH